MQPCMIPSGSVVYVHADVTAPYSPLADSVDAAILPLGSGDPTTDDWQAAGWMPGSAATVQVLVGPGTALPLTPGTYRMWVQVHDSPETPVLDAGLLVVT